jgi:primosomal protein N' (replication factor Y)
MAKLTEKYLENETSFNLSQKQKSITEILEESTAASVKEICYLCNVTPQVVKNLEKKGVISFFEYEVISTPQVTADENVDSIILTDEQQNVFSHISELIKLDKADAALLFGVTGSGKTSVFVKLIQYTLKLNKTVIMMILKYHLRLRWFPLSSLFSEMRLQSFTAVCHFHKGLTNINELSQVRQK